MNSLSLKSPALTHKAKNYPERFNGRVPAKVRMLRTVRPDNWMETCNPLKTIKGHTYEVWVNIHGAVSAIVEDKRLGLKPDEFEVIEWHDEPPRSERYPLFEHMSKEHGLTLTDNELQDICHIVLQMKVPKNWLDPRLTGPTAALTGQAGKWGCPDIERLLNAIRNL